MCLFKRLTLKHLPKLRILKELFPICIVHLENILLPASKMQDSVKSLQDESNVYKNINSIPLYR